MYMTYMEAETGLALGGNVKLLNIERSRVTHQGLHERNFHIFYQMLAGPKKGAKKGAKNGAVGDVDLVSFWDKESYKLVSRDVAQMGDYLYVDGGERMASLPRDEYSAIYTDLPSGAHPHFHGPKPNPLPLTLAFRLDSVCG